jgi:hypothetical protein
VPSGAVLAALAALTLLAAALRFATLDVQSIWLDESATMILVHRGFSGMLSHLSNSESTPPLYYVLVWAWTKVMGTGPLGFRTFSALCGTATVPVLFLAGRRISSRAGLWAAALAATNPAMYYYSQEARSYALLILLSAITFVLWRRALDRPGAARLAWWAALSMLALLTHYFAAFLFLAEAVILGRRLGWRRVAPAVGAVVATGIALVPLAAAERSNGKANWIEGASLASRAAETAKQFLVGLYGPVEILTAGVAGLLALGALALLTRAGARERRYALDAAIVAATGVLVPLLLAVAHIVDVFDGRNVIAAWVPFAVLVSAGLGGARSGRLGALLGAALCAVSLAVIAATNLKPAYQRDDWRGAANALGAGGPRVIVGTRNASLPLSVYLQHVVPVSAATVSAREIDFIALRTRRTGRSPVPGVVPTSAPRGFRLIEYRVTPTYSLSRFLAPAPVSVSVASLQQLSEPGAQPPGPEAILEG